MYYHCVRLIMNIHSAKNEKQPEYWIVFYGVHSKH